MPYFNRYTSRFSRSVIKYPITFEFLYQNKFLIKLPALSVPKVLNLYKITSPSAPTQIYGRNYSEIEN